MNVYDIERLVKEGKMNLLFSGKEIRLCLSEELSNELNDKGITEFANFAYTDYGSLHGGISDYVVIRYFREKYHGEGCTIEGTYYNGYNMILCGDALKHLREEVTFGSDDCFALWSGLEDEFTQYEWEGVCEEAVELQKDDRFAKYDEEILARCIEDCNSGMSTNNRQDYSERELLKRLAEYD